MNHGNFKWDPDEAPHPPPLTQEEGHWIRQVQNDQAQAEHLLGEAGEVANRKLWLQFQSTASSMTKMYREGQQNPEALWQCFQLSAGALTQLYKDAMEEIANVKERAHRAGYLKCRSDTTSWAKASRRRYLRREELLSAIALSMRTNGDSDSSSPPPSAERRFSPVPRETSSVASIAAGSAAADPVPVVVVPSSMSPPAASLFPIAESAEEEVAVSNQSNPQSVSQNLSNRLKRSRERGGNNSFNDDLMDLFNINVKRPRRN